MLKNDFESTNFEMFEEVVHNFGKSDDDMIQGKNAYFHQMHIWFHVQLDQKILDGLYSSGSAPLHWVVVWTTQPTKNFFLLETHKTLYIWVGMRMSLKNGKTAEFRINVPILHFQFYCIL